MFKRRRAQSRFDRVRSIVWPARGFGRLFSYLIQRIKRMPGSTLSIAIGAAWGVAVSFTPFLGLHLLVGMMLAYLTRGNLLACLFATFIGNPWTFPLFFYVDYRVGAFIITEFGGSVKSIGDTLPSFMAVFIADPAALIGALFTPIIVGCLFLGTIAWFAGFGLTYWAVDGWRRHRVKRLAAARLRRAGLSPENDNRQTGTADAGSVGNRPEANETGNAKPPGKGKSETGQ